MPDILSITGPTFLLIGLGWVAVRSGMYAKASLPALGGFVISFSLPALIFRALSQRSLAEVANVGYLGAYAAGSLLTLAAGVAWARSRGQPREAAALTGMGMSCSNSAFLGYPVVLQVVGHEATVALALTMMVENFLMIPLCLALADSAGARHEPFGKALGQSLLGLRKNPIVLGIVAGLVAALAQWHPPGPISRAVDLLANASAAVSLFYIGGNLVGLQLGGLLGQVSGVAVGKLLLHPLAVLGALRLAGPVAPALQWSAVLLAAAPMLGIYPILGQKYGRQAISAASLLAATVASFATLALLLWGLHLAWDVPLPPRT